MTFSFSWHAVTKNKPLRAEEVGVVILPRLADERDWDAIEDGDPRYSLAQPPQEEV